MHISLTPKKNTKVKETYLELISKWLLKYHLWIPECGNSTNRIIDLYSALTFEISFSLIYQNIYNNGIEYGVKTVLQKARVL